MDDDNDGVTNEFDLCADTRRILKWMARMCRSQLDVITMGWPIDLIFVPTPSWSWTWNSNGCALLNLNAITMGDQWYWSLCDTLWNNAEWNSNGCGTSTNWMPITIWVTNDKDLVLTPLQMEEVDHNVLCASQLDDDNDGVSNDLDLCSHTLPAYGECYRLWLLNSANP